MKKQSLETLNHCVFNLKYHLVLVTKYRRRCITKPILIRLKEIFNNLFLKWGCDLIDLNGESDHLHLRFTLNPKITPSKFVNNIKTVSSRLIRKEFANYLSQFFRKPVFWSRTYCIISCGGAPLTVLKQYIEQQNSPEF